MSTCGAVKNKILRISLLAVIIIFTVAGNSWSYTFAQDLGPDPSVGEADLTGNKLIQVVNPNFAIEESIASDGTQISGYIINGPPNPPAEYKAERVTSIESTIDAVILPDFPSYDWVFGCSAVSGAMIAGYYDRGAYPNTYTGPTNGGVMPLTDTSWPLWSDGYVSYPNNPLVASHNGVDGRSTRG